MLPVCRLLVILALALCTATQGSESPHLIKEPPQDETIFLGSYGALDFTCVTDNTVTVIWVNGTTGLKLSPEHPEDVSMSSELRGDGLVAHTLTIAVREQYNGTVVGCVAVDVEGQRMETKKASLLIQDTLGPVGDLKVSNTHDSILLSWSPPFSLDVTGVDPNIWYMVLISNVTDEDSPVDVPCTGCHNLTQPHYTFIPNNPHLGQVFCFMVIPQNGAGDGVHSTPITGMFLEGISTLFPTSQEQSHPQSCPSGSPCLPTPIRPEQGSGRSEDDTNTQTVLGATLGAILPVLCISVGIAVLIVVVKLCKWKLRSIRTREPEEQLVELSEGAAKQEALEEDSSQAEGQE